ncbi:MAG: GNAT family N-acetyltransferase [Planctomycetota bacterium]|jgi:RimJ/RimL family protein N-acetyltransferase
MPEPKGLEAEDVPELRLLAEGSPSVWIGTNPYQDFTDADWRTWARRAVREPREPVFLLASPKGGTRGFVQVGGVDWVHRTAEIRLWIVGNRRTGLRLAERALSHAAGWAFQTANLRKVSVLLPAPARGEASLLERLGFRVEVCLRKHGVWRQEGCDLLWFGKLSHEKTRSKRKGRAGRD